jgi:hypothetical protein
MNTPYALGAIPSPDDPRDHPLERYAAVGPLPVRFRSPVNPPVLDQGDEPWCVAESKAAGAAIDEYRERKVFPTFDVGDLFRRGGGGPEGANIRDVANVWVKIGILLTRGRIILGERLKGGSYAHLAGITQIKATIFAQYSAWVAVTWLNPWFKPANNGMLPVASPRDIAGGHAILFLGWDDTVLCPDGTHGAFIFQNSWSTRWGNGGQAWMPYSYLGSNPEAWATFDAPDCVITVTPFDKPREWHVKAGQTLSSWNPAHPNVPTTKKWAKASGAMADASVAVTWPGISPVPQPSGAFYRVSSGAYPLRDLISTSEVTLS